MLLVVSFHPANSEFICAGDCVFSCLGFFYCYCASRFSALCPCLPRPCWRKQQSMLVQGRLTPRFNPASMLRITAIRFSSRRAPTTKTLTSTEKQSRSPVPAERPARLSMAAPMARRFHSRAEKPQRQRGRHRSPCGKPVSVLGEFAGICRSAGSSAASERIQCWGGVSVVSLARRCGSRCGAVGRCGM